MTTILRIEWRWKLKPQSQGKCVHLSSVNRWSLCQYLIFKSQDLWNCHRTLSLSIINNYTIIVKSKGNVKYFKWPIRKTKHHIFSRCPISSYPISFPGLGSETRARLFGEKDAAEQVNTKLESPGWKKNDTVSWGKGPATKSDEFSEKFQTAFDPRVSPKMKNLFCEPALKSYCLYV